MRRTNELNPARPEPTTTDDNSRALDAFGSVESTRLERERRFRLSLAAASQGLYDLDTRTGMAIVTPEYLSAIGDDPSETEVDLASLAARLHPDDAEHVSAVLDACIRGDIDEYREEFRLLHRSGEWVWVLSIGRAVERDENGRANRVLGSHTLITERKHAEEALRRSEHWLSESQRVAQLGHYLYDIEDDHWQGSPTLYSVLGVDGQYTRDFTGWIALVHPDDREKLSRYFTDDVLGRQIPFDIEYRIVRPRDGVMRWVHGLGTVEFNEDGRSARMFGVIQDITEHRQSEDALRVSEQRYRALLDSANDAVYVFAIKDGRPGYFREVNERACAMLGYTRDEFLGMGIGAIDSPEQFERAAQQLKAKGSATFESEHTAKDGGRVPVEVSTSMIVLQGEPTVISVVRDITDRRDAAIELKRREVRLEELLDERERNLELLGKSLSSIIDVVSQVTEARDPYTAGHQRRVAELAVSIAKSMGESPEQIERVRIAALLHDVGKMSIPAEILSKPGSLSSAELELLKCHAETGYHIIRSASMEAPLAEMIYQHHERCDGSGYPRGLTGDELLMGAKIIMVADVVEAMSSHRPYRAALGLELALEDIQTGAGGRFDEEVVAACLRVFRQTGFEFSEARTS